MSCAKMLSGRVGSQLCHAEIATAATAHGPKQIRMLDTIRNVALRDLSQRLGHLAHRQRYGALLVVMM
jgi:hypothetical protein